MAPATEVWQEVCLVARTGQPADGEQGGPVEHKDRKTKEQEGEQEVRVGTVGDFLEERSQP